MSEQRVEVEATGETVGEARWSALHDLERRFPSLDRSAVEFVVVSEGQRGLLGVGYEPARVLAAVTVDDSAAVAAPRPVRDEPAAVAAVRELLETVLEALGKPASLMVHVDERPGQVDRHVGSTEKAERLLGWRARTSFEDGLERTIAWYRDNEAWWRAPERRPANVFSS